MTAASDSPSGYYKHTAYSANELADILSEDYSFPADTQLVRRKCNEYVKEGLLERLQKENNIFRVKHSFPVFTLEDEIAYELLLAKNNNNYVKMDIMSNKTGQSPRPVYGVPLKIFVSTRTGRRYVCIYHTIHEKGRTLTDEKQKASTSFDFRPSKPKFHFRNVRLDQIKSVRFILNRLEREGKGGELTKLADNTFLYEKIEYSVKNDRFRLLALEGRGRSQYVLHIINLSRIESITETGEYADKEPDINECIIKEYNDEPVTLLINNERNALERAMLQFANYKKNRVREFCYDSRTL